MCLTGSSIEGCASCELDHDRKTKAPKWITNPKPPLGIRVGIQQVPGERSKPNGRDTEVTAAHLTIEWIGKKSRRDVSRFVEKEKRHSYHSIGKNCQHFAYDFCGEVPNDAHASNTFEHFTEACQAIFRTVEESRPTVALRKSKKSSELIS